jgi:hypothetical protein
MTLNTPPSTIVTQTATQISVPQTDEAVFWYIPDRVLYNAYGRVITLEELNRQAILDTRLADVSPADKVHLIVDLREAVTFPTRILGITDATKMMLRHRKMGWVLVLANNNNLLRTLAKIVPQVFGIPVRLFSRIEEVNAFLVREDETLVSTLQTTAPREAASATARTS